MLTTLPHGTPTVSQCNQDKHKAPASSPHVPLSLQDGDDLYYRIRSEKFIRDAIYRIRT
jgi:hypothetical protein